MRSLALALGLLCSDTRAEPSTPRHRNGSVAQSDPLGRGAWFVDEENDAVLFASKSIVTEFSCGWPTQVVVSSSGDVYATCRAEGLVRRLFPFPAAWPGGAEPTALALDEHTGRLYVADAGGHRITAMDCSDGRVTSARDVEGEPTALALSSLGLTVGFRKSDTVWTWPLDLNGAVVRTRLKGTPPAETGGLRHLGVTQLVAASDSLVAIAAEATLGAVDQPSYYSGLFGGPIVQQLFVLQQATPNSVEPEAQVSLPDVRSATYLDEPWTGGVLLLASRGVSRTAAIELSVRGPRQLNRHPEAAAVMDHHDGLVGITDDGDVAFAFTDGDRRLRFGPSLADRAIDALRHADQRPVARGFGLGIRGIGGLGAGPALAQLQDAPDPSATDGAWAGSTTLEAPASRLDRQLAWGRQLFHTANDRALSANAVACASCHPDGRDDGRTWAGQGSLRQTPMLAGRDIAHTAPYGWNGAYPTLEKYIAFTISSRLGGNHVNLMPRGNVPALARYVRDGLRGVRRAKAQPSIAQARGRVLFDSQGCATCHEPGTLTDGHAYDVNSLSVHERRALTLGENFGLSKALRTPQRNSPRRFDTPSLLQVGLTPPYLHDGSAATLEQVFTRLGDHMGETRALSASDLSALAQYVSTL